MSQCALICISLVTSNKWAFFIYLLAICVLSLETPPWSLLPVIYLDSLFSCCWVNWAPCMLRVLTTCMTCSLRILPPFCCCCCFSADWLFRCASGHKTVIPIPMCIWPALIRLSGLCWVWREEDRNWEGKVEGWFGRSWGIAGVNLIRTHLDIQNTPRIDT